MSEPYTLTLAEMISAVRRKKLSPVELTESLLARIDSLEATIKAWVTLPRVSLFREARRCEQEALRGNFRGPLHGIPIGVKDIFYTAGMRTTGGSKIFEKFVPGFDSTPVTRLKKAGALILGKTATTEFAMADPAPTCNPWNPAHTPGGSSSGSAAAVATSMCPGALGSQTGGSVLRPAAYCGVVGLKPTAGRISRYGVFPLAYTLDHVGVLTRTVEDAALLFEPLAGFDPLDAASSREPVAGLSRFLQPPRRPLRVGLIRAFYEKNSAKAAWKNTEEALGKLSRAGAQVEEVEMPASFAAVHDAHHLIQKVEAASFHERLFEKSPGLYRPKLRELVEIGLLIPGVDYLRAQKIKGLFRREMEAVLRNYDCLISPATSSPAPKGLASTGNPWFQAPWSLSGLPTIGLPSGLDSQGFPLALQLVGKAYEEGLLLAAARWCEEVLGIALYRKLLAPQPEGRSKT
jgi:aspartyl-tRNA(Asn)/glutamyl-tRNA(Gln) amidotransferase subunit A